MVTSWSSQRRGAERKRGRAEAREGGTEREREREKEGALEKKSNRQREGTRVETEIHIARKISL